MHVRLCTHFDKAFAMSVISRYQANLGEEYWIAIKNIFKYLRRIKDLMLVFDGGSELKVEGYINSECMTDVDYRKSTSGCIFLCNDGAVSWKHFK